MDEIVDSHFAGVPVDALSLKLTRSTIKMRHAAAWRVDKSNNVHDLVVCLSGSADYTLDGQPLTLTPGAAMLIPAGARFTGQLSSAARYTGIAQHFTFDLFGQVDMIGQMEIAPMVHLSDWSVLEPLVRHYRDTAPPANTTLAQHHMFMVILLAYLEDAFRGWRDSAVARLDGQDALSLHIMLSAARLSADPVAEGVLERTLEEVPYNDDYFRRAFRDRIGYTPQKFLELKKMERALHHLATGSSVKETAALVGYGDPYFFSRMFKRYIGTSPTSYRLRRREEVTGRYVE